jgi:hypothetical protein
MWIKDRVGSAPLQQALIMYWHIRDIWNPTNLVALTVVELDDTLPNFTEVHWDSVRANHGLPITVFMWKTALGRGRTRSRLFDSHCKKWPLVLPSWLTCVVLSGYFPCQVTIDSNLCDTLGYGWTLFSEIKRRGWEWCYGCFEIIGRCWLLCSHGMMLYHLLL